MLVKKVSEKMNVPLAFAILLGVLVLSTAEPSSFCRLDLGLVVDTTKSVRSHNVPKLIASIKDLLGNLTISSSETHVSLETFSFEGTLHNQFKDEAFHSQEAMFDLVDNSIGQLRSPTRLDLAINLVNKSMFTEESGDRVGVPSVMLIFTDGRSKPNKTQDFGEQLMALRMRGVIIIAVAVGPDSKKQQYQQVLESIAGKNVFYSDDYLIPYGELRELICREYNRETQIQPSADRVLPEPPISPPGKATGRLLPFSITQTLQGAKNMLLDLLLGFPICMFILAPIREHIEDKN